VTTARFRLDHADHRLELSARRDGLRTRATLYRDGEPVGTAVGFGKVLLPVPGEPGPVPTVLVLGLRPGAVSRALLLVPRPDADGSGGGSDAAGSGGVEPGSAAADRAVPGPAGAPAGGAGTGRGGRDAALAALAEALPTRLAWMATAEKHPFVSPPGSLAARLQALERDHPGLWASRHVLLAALKVLVALLGLAAFVRLLLAPALSWLRGLVPDMDLPDIPWPHIDLPDIPWPDIDLPHLVLPNWLRVVVATAKFWAPVLAAIGLAVVEVRRRRTAGARAGQDDRGADG
jgi:hypothetical protein